MSNTCTCVDPEFFFSEGVQLGPTLRFLVVISVDEGGGGRGFNYTKTGHLNGVSLAGWFGSFVIVQGIRTNIAKKPYSYVIFFATPAPSSGSTHEVE